MMRAKSNRGVSLILATVMALAISLSPALAPDTTASTEPCSTALPAAHGHLDFLKHSTDPATAGQEGFGFVTFGTAENAAFAGVFISGVGRTTRVAVVDRGDCRLADGHLQLVVSFRDVRGGEDTLLVATTVERFEGPGDYTAEIVLNDGETVLIGGLIVPGR